MAIFGRGKETVSQPQPGAQPVPGCAPTLSPEALAATELAKTKKDQEHIFFGAVQSVCPQCLKKVSGQLLVRNGQVHMQKFCSDHGRFEVLIATDAKWWLRSLTQTKPGTIPLWHATERKTQCPDDCGLCEDHQQHTCYPLIEITDHCDLRCPICFAENKQAWYMEPDQLRSVLDKLGKAEGRAEIVTLSGGEPTDHPKFWELLELTRSHPAADKVAINTHGLKIARDEDMCRRLADMGAYVQLQFDGFSPEAYRRLRGADLTDMKRRALDNLSKHKVRTLLITTVANDLNESAVGESIRVLLERDNIHAVTLQPLVYCGDARTNALPHDYGKHMTLTTLLGLIEQQMGGAMTKEDFVSIPCSHPSCSAVGYFLNAGQNDWVSIARITQADKMLDYLRNKLLIDAETWMRDLKADQANLETLWSASAVVGAPKVQAALSCCAAAYAKERSFVGAAKMVGIHGFMDPSTYDQGRAMKCCYHFISRDGRMMPFCNYNIFHREKDVSERAAGR